MANKSHEGKIQTFKRTWIEDLRERRFGRLTVLSFLNKQNSDHRWLWKCRCDCGKVVEVSGKHLKSGNTKSCGCLQREWTVKKNKQGSLDLTGQRFGLLTAIKDLGVRNNAHYWQCQCDCGNIVSVRIGELRRGLYGDLKRSGTQSCGCLSKSVGENKIKNLLISLDIIFFREKTFDGCVNSNTNYSLRYDFYLPDYNCCIEYDGYTHFEASGGWNTQENLEGVQYRDAIKNKFCENNGIKLIRIPYTDFDKIDKQYILDRIGDNGK